MKKLLKVILCCGMLMACGCSQKNQTTAEDMVEYETYYTAICDNIDFITESQNYSCELEMTQVEDGSYRYYVVLDQPKIAMYNITAMIVENDIAYSDTDKMMPSIGIFDDQKSMIPNQVDSENGFVKGIALSGESSEATIQLKVLVQWTDKTKKSVSREFLSYTLSQNDQG